MLNRYEMTTNMLQHQSQLIQLYQHTDPTSKGLIITDIVDILSKYPVQENQSLPTEKQPIYEHLIQQLHDSDAFQIYCRYERILK